MKSAFGIDHGLIAKYSGAYGNNRIAIKELKDQKLKQIEALKAKKLKKPAAALEELSPHEHVNTWFSHQGKKSS